ncbi:TMS membrane protein tumor differentially expressed protein [Syncephalis plumigaleata]|nr:TMS membrane protein tumor differentially expressed protein [Syncephalis plumigaleata]
MGTLFSCLALECVSCFAATSCRCATKLLGCSGSIATRVGYALLFLVNSVLSWFMLSDWAIVHLRQLFHGYLEINCPEGYCFGVIAVSTSIGIALALFHILLGCSMIGVRNTRDKRAQMVGPKLLLWIGLVVLAFFIPNEFHMFWGNYIALIGAGVFILIQLVLLVSFAHDWCERCLYNYDDLGIRHWLYILVASTLGLFLFSAVTTILLFVFFAPSGCSLNQFLIMLLSVHPQVQEVLPKSGIAQASMVTAYITYVIASALVNEPVTMGDNDQCNPLSKSRSTRTTAILLGATFTLVAIVYSTSRAATQSGTLNRSDEARVPLIEHQPTERQQMRIDAAREAVESGALLPSYLKELDSNGANHDDGDDDDGNHEYDDEADECAYNYAFFHLIFALATMYVAMLLTDWNTMSGNPKELMRIGQSFTAVWVRVVSTWICVILYVWTLVAPVLFPTR